MVTQNGFTLPSPGFCLFCIHVSIMCIGYTYHIQNIVYKYICNVTFKKCTDVNKNI